MAQTLHSLKFKYNKDNRNILTKLEIKPFILPRFFSKDDSTINYVKRVGGQILQAYSLHTMPLEVQDNFSYYYLVSDTYPVDSAGDHSKHALSGLLINIYESKTILKQNENIATFTPKAKAFTLDTVIHYTHYNVQDDLSVNSSKVIDLQLLDTIRYTHKNYNDAMTTNKSKVIDFTLTSYPYRPKNVSDNMITKLSNIIIEVK